MFVQHVFLESRQDSMTSQAKLVIYTSPNARNPWRPLLQHEVPDWVQRPDIMGRLVRGEMCMDPTRGDKGSDWYKAVKVGALH